MKEGRKVNSRNTWKKNSLMINEACRVYPSRISSSSHKVICHFLRARDVRAVGGVEAGAVLLRVVLRVWIEKIPKGMGHVIEQGSFCSWCILLPLGNSCWRRLACRVEGVDGAARSAWPHKTRAKSNTHRWGESGFVSIKMNHKPLERCFDYHGGVKLEFLNESEKFIRCLWQNWKRRLFFFCLSGFFLSKMHAI